MIWLLLLAYVGIGVIVASWLLWPVREATYDDILPAVAATFLWPFMLDILWRRKR